ncbi:hypothetical protein NLX71_23230 [Paenibacillus sp. MZ04-78.2]|uniref:hypothetical protein n=1 Tax=Paenibacillus sp. MZ04-78.2 TaxID=2962034 RepID=UPI0020B6DD1F|nr:hypothetical protein [Paenibacillus sp. MZ04-78.2]MCP3776176.1 hypothetical protein [Paenibacillus sp. MZ04-78.2]
MHTTNIQLTHEDEWADGPPIPEGSPIEFALGWVTELIGPFIVSPEAQRAVDKKQGSLLDKPIQARKEIKEHRILTTSTNTKKATVATSASPNASGKTVANSLTKRSETNVPDTKNNHGLPPHPQHESGV